MPTAVACRRDPLARKAETSRRSDNDILCARVAPCLPYYLIDGRRGSNAAMKPQIAHARAATDRERMASSHGPAEGFGGWPWIAPSHSNRKVKRYSGPRGWKNMTGIRRNDGKRCCCTNCPSNVEALPVQYSERVMFKQTDI